MVKQLEEEEGQHGLAVVRRSLRQDISWGMLFLPASFDYRSQQTKYSTALGRAGAMAEFARNNPMTQRLLRFIIREGQHRIGQDAKDGIPIIEKFSCQGARLLMRHIFRFLAALPKIFQEKSVFLFQVLARPLPGPLEKLFTTTANEKKCHGCCTQHP